MFTLVIVRWWPRRRSVFIVRNDETGTEVFRSFKRAEAKAAQDILNVNMKKMAA